MTISRASGRDHGKFTLVRMAGVTVSRANGRGHGKLTPVILHGTVSLEYGNMGTEGGNLRTTH